MGKLTLSDKVLRQEKLLNYCVSLHPRLWPNPHYQDIESKGVDSVKALRSTIMTGNISGGLGKHITNVITDINGIAQSAYRRVKRAGKVKAFRLNHMSEQIPNPDSRVTLAGEYDALGLKRVQLDWRLSPVDMRSIIRAQEIIDEELRHVGLGRLYIEMHDETPPSNLTGGWHHMGTTRMHREPKKGVVDENCRVHGISNLFIAGPSVFPTCGYANPVLTTVALSVRLADHVKELMSLKGADR
jgi:choline dehydrogenase-like flavoprotein